jgi:hypothetical protein
MTAVSADAHVRSCQRGQWLRKTPGVAQRHKAVGCKTRPNKTKLVSTESGASQAHTCKQQQHLDHGWHHKMCYGQIDLKKYWHPVGDREIKSHRNEQMLLPHPTPMMPSVPSPAMSNTSGPKAWCQYHNDEVPCCFTWHRVEEREQDKTQWGLGQKVPSGMDWLSPNCLNSFKVVTTCMRRWYGLSKEVHGSLSKDT